MYDSMTLSYDSSFYFGMDYISILIIMFRCSKSLVREYCGRSPITGQQSNDIVYIAFIQSRIVNCEYIFAKTTINKNPNSKSDNTSTLSVTDSDSMRNLSQDWIYYGE